jgi:hypothetical protein
METANAILAQLGGNKFLAMTGAKGLIASGDALTFRLPAKFARDGINFVRIVLDASDTYSITFSKFRGMKITDVATREMVYADQLRSVFTSVTGLDVAL